MARHTLSSVPLPSRSKTGASCTAATLMDFALLLEVMALLPRRQRRGSKGVPLLPRARSDGPGVDDHGVVALVDQDEVEHVERADRPNSRDQRRLAMAVQRLKRETAGIDLAAFLEELADLLVHGLMPGERFVAERREAALQAERHAGAIEQHRGLESLAQQPRRLQQVHQSDRSFESDGVKGHERFLARLGLDVLEDLLLIVDEVIAFLVRLLLYRWHALHPLVCAVSHDVSARPHLPRRTRHNMADRFGTFTPPYHEQSACQDLTSD